MSDDKPTEEIKAVLSEEEKKAQKDAKKESAKNEKAAKDAKKAERLAARQVKGAAE